MKTLLKKLIQAESTIEKGELAAAKQISTHFADLPLHSIVQEWGKNRANVITWIKSRARKPALLFACHLDVVGSGRENWKYPPFAGIEHAGRIYGRGSVDMKGPTAAVITAICQTVRSDIDLQGDLIFVASAGEETNSCGTRKFLEDYRNKLPQLAGVVIPEPTSFQVVSAHRGMLWLKITTAGKSAHSSSPQLGVNAITSMKRVLDELADHKIDFSRHPSLGKCSMSINVIQGGQTINVIPDQCSIGIDIRTVPRQSHQAIIENFQRMLAGLKQHNPQFSADVEMLREVQALETDCSSDFVRDFCSAVEVNETLSVGFTTDGPFFAQLEVPVVIFGPGEPQLAHKPNEYIDVVDLDAAVDHYRKIILKFLT